MERRKLTWRIAKHFARQSVELLGSDQEIYNRLRGNKNNPLLLDFLGVIREELPSRSAELLCFGDPKDAIASALQHSLSYFYVMEQAVIALDALLENNGTVADFEEFKKRFYAALFAVDVATGLCTDRQSWVPPPETDEELSVIGKQIAQLTV